MRVVFLDIDGVLNSREYAERYHAAGNRGFVWGLCPILVERFKELVAATGAQVVLSSTWRLHKDRVKMIERAGIEIIDSTPEIRSGRMSSSTPRHLEIQDWLDRHPEVEDFVILDDDSDAKIKRHFFMTRITTGLTEEICNRIKERWAAG